MTEFFGHFHVVLVHLPIGILLLACLFQWLEATPTFNHLRSATQLALLLGMIAAIFSAVTGYLLSQSGDYDEGLVTKHQWFGISVACISILMYFLHRKSASTTLQIFTSITLFLLIIITGHLGGSITHGSGYLTSGWNKSGDSSSVVRKPIPNVQEAIAYTDVIQPFLHEKCYSCHGPNKQKGKLRMDDSTRLMKGGKDGVVIEPGNADKSDMIRRLMLPAGDDDHMPPKEKPQPSAQEIALLHWWINAGAPFNKKVRELDQPEEIKPALLALQKAPVRKIIESEVPTTPVAKGNEDAIKKLKDIGVVVEPVAQNTNYLFANFVIATNAGDNEVKMLLPLKEQLVELKLGNTAITDSALQQIAQLPNLMRLQLDHTKITDKGLASLKSLQNLRYLNLVGTLVTAEGVLQLNGLRNLQSIYLYHSGVKKSDWDALKKTFPKTVIDSGGYSVPFLATDTIEVKAPKGRN